MFKYFTLISILITAALIPSAQSKLCDIVDGFVNPGQYALDRQIDGGFCKDWVVGPVSSAKMILLSFSLVNVDCATGDHMIIYAEDRFTVLYNYCKPIAGQQTLLYVEARYIFVSLATSSSRLVTTSMRYYVFEPTTISTSLSAVEVSTSSIAAITTTATKFPTLSTASSTAAAGSTSSTFSTLSTAGLTTLVSSTSTTASTLSTRFPTLSTASLSSATQLVETTNTQSSACPSTPKLITSSIPVGVIQSPNYPSRYPNNANCYWAIEALPDEKIYLEFEVINLPTFLAGVLYANCPSDYLAIADYKNPNDVYKLCGDRNSFKLSIPYSKVLIYFYSNGVTEQQTGFRLTYRILKTGTTIVTTLPTTTTTTKAASVTTTSTTTKAGITTTVAPPTTTTTLSTGSSTPTNPLSCGVPYHTPKDTSLLRIIGGTESTPHSYPWTVLITDDSFICGASLINNNWLVTAAHCVDGLRASSLKAFLGMHNRAGTKDASTITRTIKEIIISPDYVGELNQWDADIALLKLSEPVVFTNEIKPICLPSQGYNMAILGKNGMVAGWGRTKGFGSDQVLMQSVITVDTNAKCDAKTSNMICAGISSGFVAGSCEGDSGGPFMMMQSNVFYLTGIVSWGRMDCSPPSVYTKVSNFVSWINLTVSSR